MQAEPAELSPGTAVLAVADDGVAEGGELYADLTPATRAERELEACRILPAREHPVVRDGRLAFRPPRGVNAKAPVLGKSGFEHPRLPAHVAFHERDVDSLDRTRLAFAHPGSGKAMRFESAAPAAWV